MKRTGLHHRKSKVARVDSDYSGHVITPGQHVASVSDVTGFYEKYVEPRIPVKLVGRTLQPVDIDKFKMENIVTTLGYKELLQVERKQNYGFGLGSARQLMSMHEIVQRLAEGDDSYYLTTQYDEHDVKLSADADAESGSIVEKDMHEDNSQDLDQDKQDKQDNNEDMDKEGFDEDIHDARAMHAQDTGSAGCTVHGRGMSNVADITTSSNNDSELHSHRGSDSSSEDEMDQSEDRYMSGVTLDASALNSDSDSDDFGSDVFQGHDDYEDSDAGSENADSEAEPVYVDSEHSLTAEDVAYRLRTLFQPPLSNLVHDRAFPVAPKPFDTLVTQQINLWMGSSATTGPRPDLLHPTTENLGKYVPNGNSSGLHHDHADNLYVLVEGRKRFTLYSPADARQLYTVGNINRVYSNGLIDYKVDRYARHWRHMRDDGAIIAEHARWLLEQEDFSVYSSKELEDAIDYEELYSGVGGTAEKSGKIQSGNTGMHPAQTSSNDDDINKLDPPSFSQVPPILAHLEELTDAAEIDALRAFANKHYPGFLSLHKTEVWLDAGDMLYLPSGWFHEVTSVASEHGHIALNWWFMPPVTHNSDSPYADSYWPADFEKTLAAIEYERSKGSGLR